MRKLLIPAVLLGGLAAATAAYASSSVGTIKSIDNAAMTLTLADGTVYSFPDTEAFKARLNDFKPGDRVSVSWTMMGDKHDATAISPAMADSNSSSN